MKKSTLLLFLGMALASHGAHAQEPGCRSMIGIYTATDPNPQTAQSLANANVASGTHTMYVVLSDPYNVEQDRPISVVGGFEFRIVPPANATILAAVLPPLSLNFHPDPDNWLVGTNAPVVDGNVTLLTLTISSLDEEPAEFYLAPVYRYPSIPGSLAITDYDDGFSLAPAQPASGDFARPVFGLNTGDAVHRLAPCGATVWHVAVDGDDAGAGSDLDPFLTVAQGLAAAATGDTVIVHAGTYGDDGNRDLDFAGKGIVLRGDTGVPADVVIDCGSLPGDPHDGVRLHSGEPAGTRIEGLTFKNGGISVEGKNNAWGPDGDGAAVHLRKCVVVGSPGSGLTVGGEDNDVSADSCEFRGNGYAGARLYEAPYPEGALLSECTFADNVTGVAMSTELGWRFTGCRFVGNSGQGASGLGIFLTGADFQDCLFDSNGTGYYGPVGNFTRCEIRHSTSNGLFFLEDGYNTVEDCDIHDNGGYGIQTILDKSAHDTAKSSAAKSIVATISNSRIHHNTLGGVSLYLEWDTSTVSDCVIHDNGGPGISVYSFWPTGGDWGVLDVQSCTFARNAEGLRLLSQQGQYLRLVRNVFAEHSGYGIGGLSTQLLDMADNVFWANDGGNFDDGSGIPAGANTVVADPLFCAPDSADFDVAVNSPCAASELHDRIGACEATCDGIPAPVMLAVDDVPADQGGQVRLTWYRSGHDEAGSAYPIVGYDVYRHIDAAASAVPADPEAKLLGWDFLVRVPARGDLGYQVVVPTLGDSTITGGPYPSVFMVSAATADPLVFFDSAPDTGWSLDNLAPGQPSSLTAAYHSDGVTLVWAGATEPDFAGFRVYRGDVPDFVPDAAGLAGQPFLPGWTDVLANPWGWYYKVTATDLAGNESEATAPAAPLSDVPSSLPAAFRLLPNSPNPFNPATAISFDLPEPERVRVTVFDAAGRLVKVLADMPLAAGRRTLRWNGTDAGGRAVSSGVYFARIEAGPHTAVGRMTLLR